MTKKRLILIIALVLLAIGAVSVFAAQQRHTACQGTGYVTCLSCKGTGQIRGQICSSCGGYGLRICNGCRGTGWV
jgi:hypothetical protein